MASITISKVYLLDVPLENDYKNTLFFTDAASQQSYFNSRKVKEYSNLSYQRKDYKIRVPEHIDRLYNCNYVMYQNSYYSNKWFYCFIKNMEYINDEVTEIEIETDVIQTWLFDYEVKPSFVEREHVSDDTRGLHTMPEGLETGEYISNSKMIIESGGFCFVVATTRDYFDADFKRVGGCIYNGIYSGMRYYALWTTADLEFFIKEYDGAGYGEDIYSIFVIPTSLIGDVPYNAGSPVYAIPQSANPTKCGELKVGIPTKLDGYTPRNNKLLTFPYQYLLVDNLCGGSTDYRYELFDHIVGCSFRVDGAICPGTSRILVPEAYAQSEESAGSDSVNYGLTLGKYPICNWNSDTYTNWLTQNSLNNQLQMINGVTQIGLGTLTGVGMMATGAGAVAGATTISSSVIGGVNQIAGVMATKYQQQFSPMQSKGNINCGDVITSMRLNTAEFYKMSIKEEYARSIDKYFDMFGYQVNMVKRPNKAHRSRWWYTKTIDVNIDGAIPNNDMQKIKNAYNQGITFWRNASEIQNYDLTNGIAITEGSVTG